MRKNSHTNEICYIKNPSTKLVREYKKNLKEYNNVFKKCNRTLNKHIFKVVTKNAFMPFDYIVVREDGIYVCGLLHAMGEFELQDPLTNREFEFDALRTGEIIYAGYNPYFEISNAKSAFIDFLITCGVFVRGDMNDRKITGIAVRLDNTTKFGWNTSSNRPVMDTKVKDISTFLSNKRMQNVISNDEILGIAKALKRMPNLIEIA